MKLAELFSVYSQFKLGSDPMREVSGIAIDARKVAPGFVFIATKGSKVDSHQYIGDAIEKGAIGLVVCDETLIPKSFTGAVAVDLDDRSSAAKISARYNKYPANKLFCVGVTGTNGKTSTTYLVESVLNHFGMKTGVMGTVNHHIGDVVWNSDLTTPDPITLQKRLSEFLALNAKAAVFEVSSHALEQGRAKEVPFDVGVFTNLTRDHLDYHETMENYFAAKQKLFTDHLAPAGSKPSYAILNANDEWAMKLEIPYHVNRWTFGEVRSDFQFEIRNLAFAGTKFRLKTIRGEADAEILLSGRHNVYNAVGAIAVGVAAGMSLEQAILGVSKFTGVPGRLERVLGAKSTSEAGPFVFVDYAHTDDALKTVLSNLVAIRERSRSKSKIITVFGCGGDRDKGKRPLMAKAASDFSDFIFVTSDNPRSESPMAIIQDIVTGFQKNELGKNVFVEVDRREAIRKAIEMASLNDVVLIAGKGHEDYQIIGDKKIDFSDVKTAQEFL